MSQPGALRPSLEDRFHLQCSGTKSGDGSAHWDQLTALTTEIPEGGSLVLRGGTEAMLGAVGQVT